MAEGNPCPVHVWHAVNVSRETLHGIECWNCGRDLGEHPMERREGCKPSTAFAVNPAAIRATRLDEVDA